MRIELLNVEVAVEDVVVIEDVEIEVVVVEDAVMIDNLAVAEVDASNVARRVTSRVNVPMHHNSLIQSVLNAARLVTFLVNVLKEVAINVLIAKVKATFPETALRKGK